MVFRAVGALERALAAWPRVYTFKRVFVCGLALDFCVLDTCVNASALKFKTVAMVLDAARAAHIPGLGLYGSGFLSDPKEVVGKIRDAGVSLVSVEGVTGTHPYAYVAQLTNPECSH
jgi:hypothetical protein